MSPRAIDKRARPGNEDHRTAGTPGDRPAADEPSADPEAPVEPTDQD